MLPMLVIENNNRVVGINNCLYQYTLLLPCKIHIMATPTSPKVIQQQIDAATQNQQSLVQWLGTGGLQSVLTGINENAVYRGIMAFPDTTAMSLAGGSDSQNAICPNGDGDLTLYKYYPNVDNTVVGGITSLVGGQWRPVGSDSTSISSVEISDWFQAISGTSAIVITLPTTQPDTNYMITVTPTNAYTADLLGSGYYVTTKTTTNFYIYWRSGAAPSGDFSIDFQISR